MSVSKGLGAKRAFSACAFLLVAAVPAMGLATLGPRSFSQWQSRAGELLTAPVVQGSNDPLTFDAPTVTLAQLKSPEGNAETTPREGVAEGQEKAILLDDWKYTAYYHRHQRSSEGGGNSSNSTTALLELEVGVLESEIAAFESEIAAFEALILSFESSQQHRGGSSPFR
jgi:hypothetical protein